MISPPWLPHVTWTRFAPRDDGSVGCLAAREVERVMGQLGALPAHALHLSGAELGAPRALQVALLRARSTGLSVEAFLQRASLLPAALVDAFVRGGLAWLSLPFDRPTSRDRDRIGTVLDQLRSSGTRLGVHSLLVDPSAIDDLWQTVRSLGVDRWVVSARVWPARPFPTLETTVAKLAGLVASGPVEVSLRYAPFFLRLCSPHPSCTILGDRNGLCITGTGSIFPDAAIPVCVGHVQHHRLSAVFDDHPLMRALRDPDAVEGKCGACDLRRQCGGSRARALAVTGNLFSSDPACSYVGK
jgi:radical SAM protein with 4Fe4S-binding SPASM domain